MMRYIQIALIFGALLHSPLSWSFDQKWGAKASKDIEKLISKSGIKPAQIGIYIAGGEGAPQKVYELNAKKKFIPASITKLVTAATTLVHFPQGSKFRTQLLGTAAVINEHLKGDLYLKGGGDPSFVSETMWYLVNVFTRSRIKVIEGDIVVDDTLFDSMRYDPSRQKARVDRAYDAPTGAMSFNWNSVNIFVRPGAKAGDAAQVTVDPENDYITLSGNIKTVASGTAVAAEREEKSNGDTILVSGKIAADAAEQVIYKNVTNPDWWSGSNLKSFLKQRGITVNGKVRIGKTPSQATVLAEVESKPIEHILADMNKFSNNYVAEMLAKNIATKYSLPGSIATGMTAMRDYLLKLGLNRADFELTNPSGLTRDNEFTAQDLWLVLQDMRSRFNDAPEFITSLPIAGIDGTLKKRFNGTAAERWVRAKTGLLTGVVSLAGYAGRKDGTVIPFVFIYNGNADEGSVRALFDRLAVVLVE